MPAKNGRGLDEQGCFTPSWRDSRGENDREALPWRPPDAAGNLPLGGDELLSKKRVLQLAVAGLMTATVGAVVVLVKLFLKAPTWLKIALAAAAALPMLHVSTRARIMRFFGRVKERLGETWTELQPHIQRQIDQSQGAAGVLPGKQQTLLDMLLQQ
jgi:hypothetical protein